MSSSAIWQTHTWYTVEPVNQLTVLELDFAAGQVSMPFEPVEDDDRVRNDVTAERVDGSSERYSQDTGPLSTSPPPDGVGLYDESVQLNVFTDQQLADQASWRVHLGTVDEPRYPTVTVDLTRNPDLVDVVGQVDSGDRLRILNPPSWLPPGAIDVIVQGYSETVTPFEWTWTANTTPASPWTIGVLDNDELGRLDTGGAELFEDILATDTAFDVQTTGTAVWVDSVGYPDEFPFDVKVGGEVMTVTAVAGTGLTQTFTVQRSINNVQKSHSAGESVKLSQPAVIAL